MKVWICFSFVRTYTEQLSFVRTRSACFIQTNVNHFFRSFFFSFRFVFPVGLFTHLNERDVVKRGFFIHYPYGYLLRERVAMEN